YVIAPAAARSLPALGRVTRACASEGASNAPHDRRGAVRPEEWSAAAGQGLRLPYQQSLTAAQAHHPHGRLTPASPIGGIGNRQAAAHGIEGEREVDTESRVVGPTVPAVRTPVAEEADAAVVDRAPRQRHGDQRRLGAVRIAGDRELRPPL